MTRNKREKTMYDLNVKDLGLVYIKRQYLQKIMSPLEKWSDPRKDVIFSSTKTQSWLCANYNELVYIINFEDNESWQI